MANLNVTQNRLIDLWRDKVEMLLPDLLEKGRERLDVALVVACSDSH
ncbi:hypothetical protein [Nitrosomonas communis]|nr:hypothetical protein [Nitrosomonas communis]